MELGRSPARIDRHGQLRFTLLVEERDSGFTAGIDADGKPQATCFVKEDEAGLPSIALVKHCTRLTIATSKLVFFSNDRLCSEHILLFLHCTGEVSDREGSD